MLSHDIARAIDAVDAVAHPTREQLLAALNSQREILATLKGFAADFETASTGPRTTIVPVWGGAFAAARLYRALQTGGSLLEERPA